MAEVTSESIARLRRSLGDTARAFSEDELANLLREQDGDADRALRQGLWEMLAQGARWHDYTTDVSNEKKSQIFTQLKVLYDEVDERVTAAYAVATGEVSGVPARTVVVQSPWRF